MTSTTNKSTLDTAKPTLRSRYFAPRHTARSANTAKPILRSRYFAPRHTARSANTAKPTLHGAPLSALRTLRDTILKLRVASKRYFALCIMNCALISAFAAGPRIEFPETSKSLGTFRLDLIQTMDFEFINTGDEPLLIMSVRTDCGCTAAGYPHDEIAPGDTAKISVRYNGRNNPTGTFIKQVRVRSNDPEHPLVRLFVKGKAIKG